MSSSKSLVAFVAGAAVGAIAGILLAPEKGSDIRHKISSKTSDLAESLKSTFSEFVDQVKTGYSKAEGAADDFANGARSQMNNLKEDVNSSVQNS